MAALCNVVEGFTFAFPLLRVFCRLATYGDLIRNSIYKVLNEDKVGALISLGDATSLGEE